MLYLGDCLEKLKEVQPGSVDMVLADLPYGTTACKWDSVIPFAALWELLHMACKPNAALVMFGAEPFSSALRMSNLNQFKYDWIWYKNCPTGFALAKKQPMRSAEIISVFYKKQPNYIPQMVPSRITDRKLGGMNSRGRAKSEHQDIPLANGQERESFILKERVYPRNVLEFKTVPRAKGTLHPTQKPVALLEYLIKTYTNEGDTVLDPTMGSGSTGVACKNLNRKFIGIEKEQKYFDIAKERILRKEPGLLKTF